MKKMIALLLFAALVFALAACAKKGQRYEEPPTEIITFDNGGRVVYEVVTDADGEPQTDEAGEKVYRLYDPPVTDKDGYLVTDAEGSTIRRSATAGEPVSVANDTGSGMIDDAGVPVTDASGQTVAPQTDASGQTVAPQTDADGFTLISGSKNNGKGTGQTEGETEHQIVPASTVAVKSGLSPVKAEKLIQILEDIENPFEDDLVASRFIEAKESLRVYAANVHTAQKQIMADPDLYTFVTKGNIEYWNYYLVQMQRKYDEYAAIVAALKPGERPGDAVYNSYVAFQDQYRYERELYFYLYEQAETFLK